MKNGEWRLFPPSKPTFLPGDEVFIRPKSNNERGKIGRVILQQNVNENVDLRLSSNNTNDASQRIAVELVSTKNRKTNDLQQIVTDEVIGIGVVPRPEQIEPVQHESIQQQLFASNEKVETGRDESSNHHQRTFRKVRLIKRYHNVDRNKITSTTNSINNSQSTKPKCRIFITAKTNHFRTLAMSQLNPSVDQVLEIGCSNGECSTIIIPYCKTFIGFDTSTQMIAEAKEKMKLKLQRDKNCSNHHQCRNDNDDGDDMMFHTIDPFVDPNHAKQIAMGVNVVLIDIGGNREIDSVVLMIKWVQESLSDVSLIIIKSEEMFDCIKTLNEDGTCSISSVVSTEDDKDDETNSSTTTQSAKGIKRKLSIDNIHINETDGLIINCKKWYDHSLIVAKQNSMRKVRSAGPPKYLHPLRAPMALSPVDKCTPICRYHNYHEEGCKYQDDCQFDHQYCHWCLQKGHIALECTFVGLLKIEDSQANK